MIALTAGEVAGITGGTLHGLRPSTMVAGPVVADSREVVPGALFAAIAGEHSDGHAFAAAAVAAGAVAVLAAHEVTGPDGAGVPAVVVPDVVAALGALAREVLCRLREAAASLKSSSGDPGLDAVLSEIELRVEVELAKAGQF